MVLQVSRFLCRPRRSHRMSGSRIPLERSPRHGLQGTDKGVVLIRYIRIYIYIYTHTYIYLVCRSRGSDTKVSRCLTRRVEGDLCVFNAYLQLNTFRFCDCLVRRPTQPQHTTGRRMASPGYSGTLPRHFDIGVRVHYRYAILSHLLSRDPEHQAAMSGTAAITPRMHQPRLAKKAAFNSEVIL